MKLSSVIKAPEGSVVVGIAEAGVVLAIYQGALPSHTDIRSADPHNKDVEAARKRAAWSSAAILGVVLFITQDINSFLIGAAALAANDFMVKHANSVNPDTGRMPGRGDDGPPADNEAAFPLPDYADDDADLDDPGY